MNAATAQEPALILGTAQLRGTYGAVGRPPTPRSDRAAGALLQRAVDLGFAAVDTAPAYDDAETLIGQSALGLAVHTKIDPDLTPAASLGRSLQRLRRTRVDLLYFHDPEIVTRDTRGLINDASVLVGTEVGRLGASVYTSPELRAVIDDDRFGAVQVPMSVLDRSIDDTDLSRARARGLQVFARSVFLQGVLLAPPGSIPRHLAQLVPYVASLRTVAEAAGISVPALALGWVKMRPGIIGVVVGANSMRELEQVAEAWAQPALDDDALAACRALPIPPPDLCDPRDWTGPGPDRE